MKLKYILFVCLFANAWATSTCIHSPQKRNSSFELPSENVSASMLTHDAEVEVHISSVLNETGSEEESVLNNEASKYEQDLSDIASHMTHGNNKSGDKRSFVSNDHGSPVNKFQSSFQGRKAEEISIKSSGTSTIPLASLTASKETNIQNIKAGIAPIPDMDLNQEASETDIPVRKCCEENEFYSIQSQQCEPAGGNSSFLTTVANMFVEEGTRSKLNTIPGIISKCLNSGSPPQVTEVSQFSHTLLPTGVIKDSYSPAVYNHNQYCLEVASFSRDNLEGAPVVIAYCLPKEQNSLSSSLKETVVRKCCTNNEHFNTLTYKCEPGTSGSIFQSYVENVHSNLDSSLGFIHGQIKWCPRTESFPKIRKIDHSTHAISPNGHLIDLMSSTAYDHKNYCVELAMGSSGDLETSDFVAAYCPIDNTQVPIRKCCNLNQYLDNQTQTCKDRGRDMSNYNNLILDFFHRDPPATKILVGKLKCESNMMKRSTANEMYLDKTGQLCDHSSGNCYPSSSYCIEHFGSRLSSELESRAFFCPSNSFRKCCKPDEVLSDTGCVKPGRYYTESSRLSQLKELLLPKTGFPMADDLRCEAISVSSSESDLHWWVNKHGALSLRTTHGEITTEQYCVDDFEGKGMAKETVVMLCRSEMQQLLPRAISNSLTSSSSIGKCCPNGQHLKEDFSCVENTLQTNLTNKTEFVTANVTDMTFTSFPICQQGSSYHIYMLGQRENDDFADLTATNIMKIVYKDRGCISYQHILKNSEYCLDDYFTGSDMDAIVAVCPAQWKESTTSPNRYKILLALSSISCISLIVTAVFIFTRAKRPQETLNKAQKLSISIQLGFVFSNLLAFLLLAVGTQTSFDFGPLCYTYASLLMFFLLSAFMWNTSICLESLLHKMRFEIPENIKYFCHALWAWGVPGAITAIALTLDLNRDALPCSTVTPKFGVYQCFFSDRTAKLLYLYLPMFVSVCANVVLLLLTKYTNKKVVRRLSNKLRSQSSVGLAEDVPDEIEQEKVEDGNRPRPINQPSLQFDNEYLGIGAKENMLTKYFKLITWSGVLWVFEFVNFLLSDPEELTDSWYNYLWYIPSSINALRGTALFLVMVVLMPQYRPGMRSLYQRVCSRFSCGSS
ncbi:uncharacterized protein [Palaemon carinicauda]|uniref:uncharacterized protein n=1 Tax=Palaemon carinicauda TaxID=392227 RepID=UPI0035B67187